MYRIGHSIDVHQLVEGRELILGGVKIPHTKGLLGHSDADVLTHAITEAIIGALGLGDLGTHFPDTDLKFKGVKSLNLLEHTIMLMKEKGYEIGNIDATIQAEKPKINPHVNSMKTNISKIVECSLEDINIKATRGEKLGYIGREEGICANAVVLLKKKPIAVKI